MKIEQQQPTITIWLNWKSDPEWRHTRPYIVIWMRADVLEEKRADVLDVKRADVLEATTRGGIWSIPVKF